MKNSLLLFLIFFLLRPCNAISRDFTFSNINESFGISMREITAAVRDDDGFIWLLRVRESCVWHPMIIGFTSFHLLQPMCCSLKWPVGAVCWWLQLKMDRSFVIIAF